MALALESVGLVTRSSLTRAHLEVAGACIRRQRTADPPPAAMSAASPTPKPFIQLVSFSAKDKAAREKVTPTPHADSERRTEEAWARPLTCTLLLSSPSCVCPAVVGLAAWFRVRVGG